MEPYFVLFLNSGSNLFGKPCAGWMACILNDWNFARGISPTWYLRYPGSDKAPFPACVHKVPTLSYSRGGNPPKGKCGGEVTGLIWWCGRRSDVRRERARVDLLAFCLRALGSIHPSTFFLHLLFSALGVLSYPVTAQCTAPCHYQAKNFNIQPRALLTGPEIPKERL